VAAEARVELVLVDLSAGPKQRRLLRRLPTDLSSAVERLEQGAA
jgi:acyl-CoA thioester hydrolase